MMQPAAMAALEAHEHCELASGKQHASEQGKAAAAEGKSFA
jgi:hypothetical protein